VTDSDIFRLVVIIVATELIAIAAIWVVVTAFNHTER
jgi:hypothetical protein